MVLTMDNTIHLPDDLVQFLYFTEIVPPENSEKVEEVSVSAETSLSTHHTCNCGKFFTQTLGELVALFVNVRAQKRRRQRIERHKRRFKKENHAPKL